MQSKRNVFVVSNLQLCYPVMDWLSTTDKADYYSLTCTCMIMDSQASMLFHVHFGPVHLKPSMDSESTIPAVYHPTAKEKHCHAMSSRAVLIGIQLAELILSYFFFPWSYDSLLHRLHIILQ